MTFKMLRFQICNCDKQALDVSRPVFIKYRHKEKSLHIFLKALCWVG